MQEFKNLDELIKSILEPKLPNLPVVTDAKRTIFWQELPNLIENWLQRAKEAGIDKQNPIILFGHKEAEYLVAIAACFVAGIVYIPVDKAFPDERINKISSIANASHIYKADLDAFVQNEKFNKNSSLKEKDLAYIMFTSGSTGEPKGVQIGRESILGLVNWIIKDFKFCENPKFMNQALFSFDLSCYEIYATLGMAGHIILSEAQEFANPNWLDKFATHNINVWVSTPSFAYSQIVNPKFNGEFLNKLDAFLFCGEVLPLRLAKLLKSKFKNTRILNTYGPTEATVATSIIEITEEVLANNTSLPVGYPMPNTRIDFIENDELVIIGENVMRGYLNREDLNSTKLFIDEKTGFRAFKTGDAGYKTLVADKELIYCTGRLDSQIKLHGYRIELDEIEANLDAIAGIHKSVIVPLRKADASVLRILAFYISLPDTKNIEVDFLKKSMALNLPEYMIPSEFIRLDEFPTNSNNKIDRKQILINYSEQNKNLKK